MVCVAHSVGLRLKLLELFFNGEKLAKAIKAYQYMSKKIALFTFFAKTFPLGKFWRHIPGFFGGFPGFFRFFNALRLFLDSYLCLDLSFSIILDSEIPVNYVFSKTAMEYGK